MPPPRPTPPGRLENLFSRLHYKLALRRHRRDRARARKYARQQDPLRYEYSESFRRAMQDVADRWTPIPDTAGEATQAIFTEGV